MKKIILVAAASLLLTGCWLQKPVSQNNEPESKAAEFTGNLKEAMAKNLPMKCEWQLNNDSGTFYVKDKKVYAETVVEGKKGYMISKDNCIWTWGEQIPQGAKFCTEPTAGEAETSIVGQPEAADFETSGLDTTTVYKCNPAVFGNEKFEPPSGVQFPDMAEMMKGLQQSPSTFQVGPEEEEE